MKLPIDYYRFKGLELTDPNPPPVGYTKTKSGILISKEDEQRRYLACLHQLVGNKYEAWTYEQERRFLYDLRLSWHDGLKESEPDGIGAIHEVAMFDPNAVTEIVFGYKCSSSQVHEILPLIERFPQAKLFYVDFHPHKYEVRVHAGDKAQIFATHRRREESSFRSRSKKSPRISPKPSLSGNNSHSTTHES